MSEANYLSGWKYRAVIFSVVLSALGYLLFSLWGGWQAVNAAIKEVGAIGIAIALLMSSLNYALRFLRWQGYLKALGYPISWQPSLRIYLSGFALTTTPGKAGEALRGVLLKPWGVPYSKSFAAFFSERLSDLIAVVLLTLFGLTQYPAAQSMVLLATLLALIGLLAFSQRRVIEGSLKLVDKRNHKLFNLVRHLLQILLDAQACHRLHLLLSATLLSIIAWSSEALAFYWILSWMGAEITPTFAVFVYALAMLAGALSFMPGGLGGAEAVMVSLLVWKGMPTPDAIAATVLIRLATLWFAVGIGAISLWYSNIRSVSDTH